MINIHPAIGFGICALVIVFSGIRLSKYGAVIAEKTGLSKGWIGLVLLASVTSLPELITGVGSVVIVSAPDIAVGDILGSCCFNLLILSVIDALIKPKPLSSVVRRGHVLTGAFGILLLTIVVIHILYAEHIFTIAWISPVSILFVLIYLLALRLIFHHERKDTENPVSSNKMHASSNDISLTRAIFRYIFNAIIVVFGALALPYFADEIALIYNLEKSFVGTFMVAAATSLPELVVSIAAVRMGSVDMAVGNLFGSNLFNILILAIDDFLYLEGALLANISSSHIISALSAIIMTAIAAIGLTFRAERKRIILAVDTFFILLIYILLIYFLYISG